jgi:hypothetical protein
MVYHEYDGDCDQLFEYGEQGGTVGSGADVSAEHDTGNVLRIDCGQHE